MLDFMKIYITHLSHPTAPLKELLKKNQVFYSEDHMNAAFQKPKTQISKAHSTPLQNCKRDLPVIVLADASKHGLNAYLLQKSKLIPFATSPLADAQTWFANIERVS